jgi:hypothetical protein
MDITAGGKHMRIISIAKDFSVYPGGRTPEDGPFSGQEFRETFLIPALSGSEEVEINFDGTRGYGSSFLEEAFGGLVRKGFMKNRILSVFRLVSLRHSIIDEVRRYIDTAQSVVDLSK